MQLKKSCVKCLTIDFSFWKNREKQILEFYDQIDQRIGDFLTITKSPCVNIYREMIESTVAGTLILLISYNNIFHLKYELLFH